MLTQPCPPPRNPRAVIGGSQPRALVNTRALKFEPHLSTPFERVFHNAILSSKAKPPSTSTMETIQESHRQVKRQTSTLCEVFNGFGRDNLHQNLGRPCLPLSFEALAHCRELLPHRRQYKKVYLSSSLSEFSRRSVSLYSCSSKFKLGNFLLLLTMP